MSKLKNKELIKLQESELNSKISELRKELMKLRAQVSRGSPLENPGRIRAIKRDVARMLTVLTIKKTKGGAN